jgi:hypothetical protein
VRNRAKIWRIGLQLLLCLALSVWSLKAPLSHGPAQALNQITLAVQAAQQAAEHGHSHGEAADLMWAQHGHSHDAADHDHNPVLAPGRIALSADFPPRRTRARTGAAPPQLPVFTIDRPPRLWKS